MIKLIDLLNRTNLRNVGEVIDRLIINDSVFDSWRREKLEAIRNSKAIIGCEISCRIQMLTRLI